MKTILCAFALFLAGCVSSGTQVQESALQQFQKGVTTEADVVKALGTPQSSTLLPDSRRMITYVGTSAHAKASSYVPVVGLFTGGAVGKSSVTSFTFGTDGKLAEVSSTTSNVDANTGIAAQPNIVK